ncbi:PQQ-binding-like beta-propeller repeat protein [Paraburkholderia sp. MM5482-R1]|uniref:PQQ-binding-like beta-propeller repeat protein n=1 Tax=unclassified Paraburkholderia TaxID=2615204 RepID=UPI003D1D649A
MTLSVTTRSIDTARSGANTGEIVLTPAAVRARGLKQALVLRTPDDPRLEAQPLYLSSAKVRGETHDTIVQATMGNRIYAWDADTGELLWSTHLGPPINESNAIDAHPINVHWGILSTPVIDPAEGRLYACYWSSPSGDWKDGHHFVASLDIATGAQTHPAIDLEGVEFDPGDGLPKLEFRSLERKQRGALALLDETVLIPFGTIAESGGEARGWLIAIDTRRWACTACWCSTSRGNGAGIWMSGSAPAIQSDGSIWLVTGNGEFDGSHDFGESVVCLRYTPPAGTANAKFAVTGWWTPWTDDGRLGENPGGEAAAALLPARVPSNFRVGPHLARLGMADMGATWSDQDLGSSGIVLIEELGIALVSGKDGILYTIRLDLPGDTTQADLAPARVTGNFSKLSAPPILYTYYDPSVDPAPTNSTALNVFAANRTHHLHGTPIVWKSASRGWMHFCGGENGNLRAWQFNPDRSSKYLACSEAYASPECTEPFGGMPGWSIALSANTGSDAIVWAMIPYGDANMTITNTRLLAYDAQDFGRYADGSGEILPLWDSQDWNWNVLHPKFNRPVAVDGRVLVPTYGGELLVLTLA